MSNLLLRISVFWKSKVLLLLEFCIKLGNSKDFKAHLIIKLQCMCKGGLKVNVELNRQKLTWEVYKKVWPLCPFPNCGNETTTNKAKSLILKKLSLIFSRSICLDSDSHPAYQKYLRRIFFFQTKPLPISSERWSLFRGTCPNPWLRIRAIFSYFRLHCLREKDSENSCRLYYQNLREEIWSFPLFLGK